MGHEVLFLGNYHWAAFLREVSFNPSGHLRNLVPGLGIRLDDDANLLVVGLRASHFIKTYFEGLEEVILPCLKHMADGPELFKALAATVDDGNVRLLGASRMITARGVVPLLEVGSYLLVLCHNSFPEIITGHVD